MNKKIIGITGYANTGKDTLANIIISNVEKRGFVAKRFSFAELIKLELRPLFHKFGIDPWNCSREDKEKIRDVLVSYGVCVRELTKGRYLIDAVQKEIEASYCDIAIITDVRFCEFEDDELSWLLKDMGGILIDITRYSIIDCLTNKRHNDNSSLSASNIEIVFYGPRNEKEKINSENIKKYIEENGREHQVIDFIWGDFENRMKCQ